MESYALRGQTFCIEGYDKKPPFTSFLPGLAGELGIPIWSFYTNRGQGICSFGIHHKGNAMMEFFSANTGYENTPIRGFRTFLRVNGEYIAPFFADEPDVRRTMEIEENVLTIRETRENITLTVTYFVLPEENLGALVRRVSLKNTGEAPLNIEALDGMPQIIPYGIQNGQYKEMSNLFKSWADIVNLHAPIYKMRASSDDSAEVKEIEGGYFYCAAMDGELLPIIYDKTPVFGVCESMITPEGFVNGGLDAVMSHKQCFYNKVPCGFAAFKRTLAPGAELNLTAYAGYTPSEALINSKLPNFRSESYAEAKCRAARRIARELTADVETHTADAKLNAYVRQCYLDNFLRGGYPVVFGEGSNKKVVHLYSRKHGDPERDYNFFSTAGEFFSQGNGNYRDVCQNRRLDCFLHPEIGDFNVRMFFSLIQMDGYNPLEIRPSTFTIDEAAGERIAAKYIEGEKEPLLRCLRSSFTPGKVTNTIAEYGLTLKGSPRELIGELLANSEQHAEAGFGEGYWSDHWDYNLDLIEDYLSVYPDKKRELLFGGRDYRYYNSIACVSPRRETYVVNKGHVRQYGSLRRSEAKAALPGFEPNGTNWLRDEAQNEVKTTLFEKLLTLAVNKFALLDCEGLGIEMEGGRPGWNDAMNGLPGLLGSGMPETLELRRLVNFLLDELRGHDRGEEFELFAVFADFLRRLAGLCSSGEQSLAHWNAVCELREDFRERIERGIENKTALLTAGELTDFLSEMHRRLEDGIARALEIGNGIMPTYFTYEATDYELNAESENAAPSVSVKALKRRSLPYFLEGPARYLASCTAANRAEARKMAAAVAASELYDRELKMYKTSVSIEGESMEIGRVRAFTPGWLERESVFLHMEYKYFYGLLRSGLYKEFYEAANAALIPHLDPERYGRSILENSSFLASSANPDPSVHGRGFVGRLSGSTVELLSMWKGVLIGEGGFKVTDGELGFTFAPVLAGALFDENGEVSFRLFGKTEIVYVNPERLNTYEARVEGIEADGAYIPGNTLGAELAHRLRRGELKKVRVVIHG